MKLPRSLAFVAAGFLLAPALRAADPPLPAKHVKAGVHCHDCHGKENPSKAAVADESCMACHGDFPAMAAYTKQLPVNPHAPLKKGHAPASFACTDCHRQHRPPVVKCKECHPDFKLTPR
ncbi:MAG TPA: cytochrome c3 family protein [Holophaga sp.]|nr:cytochrome c3 family protein [Holophaga sp.]